MVKGFDCWGLQVCLDLAIGGVFVKIEMGESLLLSWLKHIKECQLVQLNWKPSSKWDMKYQQSIEQMMAYSSELFAAKYEYDLFKGTKSVDQLISQAEIDVVGICYENQVPHVYGVDVAFHEAGLNYGSKDETVVRIIKKCLRSVMCLYGYFGFEEGTIVFASPKINPAVHNDLMRCIEDIEQVLVESRLRYQIRIIGNEDFSETILEPVLNVLNEVADTSELFMRSLQMYNLFVSKGEKRVAVSRNRAATRVISLSEGTIIESRGLDSLKEMKIGVLVRTVLRRILEEGKVPYDEIERMQSKSYSKETFDIQYPLLQKASLTQGRSPARYYSAPLRIDGEDYFLCSEWYEVPANNDRPYLMKWLGMYL
jgi:hypothetical protein